MEAPYTTLGVANDATAAQIRTAYRKLAKQHLPDLNPGNTASETRFKSVTAAGDLPSNPERSGRFDRGEIDGSGQAKATRPAYREYAEADDGTRYGRREQDAGGWNEEDFADILGSLKNRSFVASRDGGPTASRARGWSTCDPGSTAGAR